MSIVSCVALLHFLFFLFICLRQFCFLVLLFVSCVVFVYDWFISLSLDTLLFLVEYFCCGFAADPWKDLDALLSWPWTHVFERPLIFKTMSSCRSSSIWLDRCCGSRAIVCCWSNLHIDESEIILLVFCHAQRYCAFAYFIWDAMPCVHRLELWFVPLLISSSFSRFSALC